MKKLFKVILHSFFASRLSRGGRAQRRIDVRTSRAVRKWIAEEGYRRSLTMEEVAESLGIETHQLAYYCRKIYGRPFSRWRCELRIADAKEIMARNPDAPVSLIGQMVGIPDRANFRKLFRRVTGMWPMEWRRRTIPGKGRQARMKD